MGPYSARDINELFVTPVNDKDEDQPEDVECVVDCRPVL